MPEDKYHFLLRASESDAGANEKYVHGPSKTNGEYSDAESCVKIATEGKEEIKPMTGSAVSQSLPKTLLHQVVTPNSVDKKSKQQSRKVTDRKKCSSSRAQAIANYKKSWITI